MPGNSQRVFRYVFTVDTDSDAYFGAPVSARARDNKAIRGWVSLERGREPLLQSLDGLRDSEGRALPVTWFVRCDRQIEKTQGDAGYLLQRYATWWHERLAVGDDVQWHAHLYRAAVDGMWEQEKDLKRIQDDVAAGKHAFERSGFRPKAIRIGECFQTTELVNYLRTLDLRADCTALPGRMRQDGEKCFDWTGAPNRPYRPHSDDCRQLGGDGGFWEVPINTLYTQASYDPSPLLRYFNPSFRPETLVPGLIDYCRESSVLVGVMHLFEIMPEFIVGGCNGHPLLSFSPAVVARNIGRLKEIVEQMGGMLRFQTMSELLDDLDAGMMDE